MAQKKTTDHSEVAEKLKNKAKSRAKSKIKRKVKNKVKKSPIIITILILLAVAALLFCQYSEQWFGFSIFPDKATGETVPVPNDGEILFHFIDIGQGDAILITTKSGNMLIDTGESSERDKLVSYLDAAGVTSFRYVVFTHTDADHIGSADYIIKNYDVQTVILPDDYKTTETYKRMKDALDEKQTDTVLIGEEDPCEQSGYSFLLGSMRSTVIAPIKDYDDANEMSIVIKAQYGNTSVMLTGDAETESEGDIVDHWDPEFLKCDVLKVGHHGSRTSTTSAFLNAVSPKIAVISCGEGNSYGHPHAETLEKLKAKGITVYRTDILGTVVLKSDGETIVYVEK